MAWISARSARRISSSRPMPGRRLGHAGAGGDRPVGRLRGHPRLQVLHQVERVDGAAAADHQRELVAADAVGAGAGAGRGQPCGQRADALVAGLVADAVVGLLQPVQVEQRQAERLRRPRPRRPASRSRSSSKARWLPSVVRLSVSAARFSRSTSRWRDPLQPVAVAKRGDGRGQQQQAQRDRDRGGRQHHLLASLRFVQAGQRRRAVAGAGAVELRGHRVEGGLQVVVADRPPPPGSGSAPPAPAASRTSRRRGRSGPRCGRRWPGLGRRPAAARWRARSRAWCGRDRSRAT